MGESQSGGGVDTDVGGGGQDSSPSYSDLGQSPGAMGGSAPATPSYGMSPGAMGGRNVDDSPSYSSRPDPSTAMPLRVDTQVKPRIRFNPVTDELLKDQREKYF